MRPFRLAAVLCALALTAPALAQRAPFDVTLWGSMFHSSGTTASDTVGTEVKFGDTGGFGLSVNVPIVSWLSVEAGASRYSPSAKITYRDTPVFDLGRMDTTPLTLMLEAHPAGRGDVDPYIGVGGAWVIFGDLSGSDLDLAGIGRVTVKDKGALSICAGVRFALGPRVGLTIDGKYLWLKPESTNASGHTLDLEINPFLASFGVGFRF